ncbi:MAG: hypothetical protein HC897_08070 [Thermoanaerobaculia bacterium]|nr:hypothetical protein [Thermoanaerobaculia bacterium]
MAEIVDVRLPDLGDFDQVSVVEVLVAPGDRVGREQGLIVLESDKASMEVPAPRAGTVREVLVSAGAKVGQRGGDLAAGSRGGDGCETGRDRCGADGSGSGRPGRGLRRGGGGHDRSARARCRGRWLYRGVSRGRSRQAGGAGGAREDARRGLSQRRLHPLEGAPACRQGDRRGGRFRRARDHLRPASDRSRPAPRVEGRRRRPAHPRGHDDGQTAQGRGDSRRGSVSLAAHARGRDRRGRGRGAVRARDHRRRLAGRRAARVPLW